MLQVGSSRVMITPPLGTALAGYPGRPAGANRIHDDLFIRVVAMESGGQLAAMMAADLMGVEVEWVDELRRRAQAAFGLSPADLMFATTHAHSATGRLFSPQNRLGGLFRSSFDEIVDTFDETLYELLLRQALTGLRLALESMRPATLAAGTGSAPGIAANRIDPAREVDDSVTVLTALDERNRPIAALLRFTCHPTVLGDKDCGVSADFPGIACAIVEHALGPGAVAMHVNGALGDVSTRFTRRCQSYGEVQRFGRILGGAALQAIGLAEPLKEPDVGGRTATVQVSPKSVRWIGDPEDRARKLREDLAEAAATASHGEIRQLRTALQGAESAVKLAEALRKAGPIEIEVQRLKIAEGLDLVAVPAEMFSASARSLQDRFPGRDVRLVGPANGYIGYVPDSAAYERGGYEVDSALVDQGAAEAVLETASTLLGQS